MGFNVVNGKRRNAVSRKRASTVSGNDSFRADTAPPNQDVYIREADTSNMSFAPPSEEYFSAVEERLSESLEKPLNARLSTNADRALDTINNAFNEHTVTNKFITLNSEILRKSGITKPIREPAQQSYSFRSENLLDKQRTTHSHFASGSISAVDTRECGCAISESQTESGGCRRQSIVDVKSRSGEAALGVKTKRKIKLLNSYKCRPVIVLNDGTEGQDEPLINNPLGLKCDAGRLTLGTPSDASTLLINQISESLMPTSHLQQPDSQCESLRNDYEFLDSQGIEVSAPYLNNPMLTKLPSFGVHKFQVTYGQRDLNPNSEGIHSSTSFSTLAIPTEIPGNSINTEASCIDTTGPVEVQRSGSLKKEAIQLTKRGGTRSAVIRTCAPGSGGQPGVKPRARITRGKNYVKQPRAKDSDKTPVGDVIQEIDRMFIDVNAVAGSMTDSSASKMFMEFVSLSQNGNGGTENCQQLTNTKGSSRDDTIGGDKIGLMSSPNTNHRRGAQDRPDRTELRDELAGSLIVIGDLEVPKIGTPCPDTSLTLEDTGKPELEVASDRSFRGVVPEATYKDQLEPSNNVTRVLLNDYVDGRSRNDVAGPDLNLVRTLVGDGSQPPPDRLGKDANEPLQSESLSGVFKDTYSADRSAFIKSLMLELDSAEEEDEHLPWQQNAFYSNEDKQSPCFGGNCSTIVDYVTSSQHEASDDLGTNITIRRATFGKSEHAERCNHRPTFGGSDILIESKESTLVINSTVENDGNSKAANESTTMMPTVATECPVLVEVAKPIRATEVMVTTPLSRRYVKPYVSTMKNDNCVFGTRSPGKVLRSPLFDSNPTLISCVSPSGHDSRPRPPISPIRFFISSQKEYSDSESYTGTPIQQAKRMSLSLNDNSTPCTPTGLSPCAVGRKLLEETYSESSTPILVASQSNCCPTEKPLPVSANIIHKRNLQSEDMRDDAQIDDLNRLTAASHFYAVFNETVFGSRLPLDVKLSWNNRMTRSSGFTRIHHDLNSRWVSVSLSIKLLTTVQRLRKTLLHEMCHVAQIVIDNDSGPTHGSIFMHWAKHANRIYPELPITKAHRYD